MNDPTWFDYEDDGDECPHCCGDGFIDACDGDPTDWGEDTYCGPDDATIRCRHCNGKGLFA